MSPRDFVKEIPELNRPNVHIKNRANLNKLINAIVEGGSDKLQVVSDFDRTITKQHENGKKHLSSFGMFSECKSIPQYFIDAEQELTNKYLPLEIDPSIPFAEKRKYMEEWWALSENIFKNINVPLEELDTVAATLAPSLRDGCEELFALLCKEKVPVLVFSAGLGDSVVAVLNYNKVLLPNVKVISNFLKYDDQGAIQGFKNKAIHVLNKNELALKGTEYYDLVQNRGNVILLGDSLGDAGMADGVPHSNAVLKIGFLYDVINESLPKYMDTFDIVLEDDQTVDVVLAILKHAL